MRLRTRALIPAMLVVAGILLLVGCIYIPNFSHGLSQQSSKPGEEVVVLYPYAPDPKSALKFRARIGATTRDQSVSALGQPQFATRDGRSLLYNQERCDGYFVYPLCFFYTEPNDNGYLVRLNFDQAGVLASVTTDNRDFSEVMADRTLVNPPRWRAESATPQWPPPLLQEAAPALH